MRSRRTTWGRSVLGAFTVAWLSIVMQPCVMAMGVETDPCPHCPPVETHGKAPCEVTISPDCATDDQISAETRNGQLKLKDSSNELPLAIAQAPYESVTLARTAQMFANTSVRLNPSGPPLNVLYCVYLK